MILEAKILQSEKRISLEVAPADLAMWARYDRGRALQKEIRSFVSEILRYVFLKNFGTDSDSSLKVAQASQRCGQSTRGRAHLKEDMHVNTSL